MEERIRKREPDGTQFHEELTSRAELLALFEAGSNFRDLFERFDEQYDHSVRPLAIKIDPEDVKRASSALELVSFLLNRDSSLAEAGEQNSIEEGDSSGADAGGTQPIPNLDELVELVGWALTLWVRFGRDQGRPAYITLDGIPEMTQSLRRQLERLQP